MIKVTKIAIAPEAVATSATSVQEYRNDVDTLGMNGVLSTPIEYWITGEYITQPKIGQFLQISRHTRNGENVPGIFVTSPVVSWNKQTGILTTANSVYKIEEL